VSIVYLAIILGLIQALTEFLPISSSGHLLLARAALDFDVVDGLTFDVAVHVGTLAAIVVYFRREIGEVTRGFLRTFVRPNLRDDVEQRLAWYVIAACIPAGLAGALFETQIEIYFRHPGVVVFTLAAGAVLFLAVERWCRPHKTFDEITLRGALFIGLLQTLALIPGVSRSGITIAGGMIVRLRREEAARFSFVMASPLLAGAGLKKGLDLVGQPMGQPEIVALVVGVLTSGLAGWLVIRFLIGFLRRHGLYVFAYYRFVLAAAVAAYLLITAPN